MGVLGSRPSPSPPLTPHATRDAGTRSPPASACVLRSSFPSPVLVPGTCLGQLWLRLQNAVSRAGYTASCHSHSSQAGGLAGGQLFWGVFLALVFLSQAPIVREKRTLWFPFLFSFLSVSLS